jgi:hypothetical protein
MAYYVGQSGRTAVFTLKDSNGSVISEVTGKQKGQEPLQRNKKLPGYPEGYPLYEIISVGEITEIIEHRKMEPIFYISDDPEIRAEFADQGRFVPSSSNGARPMR